MISLLFKYIICFYVALYIEHILIILMRTRISVSPHKKYIPPNSAIPKTQKTISIWCVNITFESTNIQFSTTGYYFYMFTNYIANYK
jgi:hypothetical protein